MREPFKITGVEEIAKTVSLPLEKVQDYADRGLFDGDGKGGYFHDDSVFRCGLISNLENYWNYSAEEIDGIIRYMDVTKTARMGGGRVRDRYVPFEQELSKSGPVWICMAQGEYPPDRVINFTVHGEVKDADPGFLVIRNDTMVAQEGQIEFFELLDKIYGRGKVKAGLLPGTYRIHFGGCGSFSFKVSETAEEDFINLMLRYFRGTRCGEETEYHPACHQDDAIRNDTGGYYPLKGGWHDAGDYCHITSTTTASFYLAKACEFSVESKPFHGKLVEEALYGADYNLRARDPETGKVFEAKGVGKGGLNGQFGDNHRMTDNKPGTGDERHIRTEGAVQTAMDCISALAVMGRVNNEISAACIEAGEKSWAYHEDQENRAIYQIAKRVIACLEWHKTTGDGKWLNRMEPHFKTLCASIDSDGDVLNLDGRILFDHYQHGTPFLALTMAAEAGLDISEKAKETAVKAADRLVALAKLQPYGITCYSITKDEHIELFPNQDTLNTWHSLDNGKSYRMYQPFTTAFWMGGVSHLSVLGLGLAILYNATEKEEYLDLAWAHYDWCVGKNPYQCCMVSGWGELEASPHSGAVGYMPGAAYQGPIGDQNDDPYFQTGFGMRIGEEPKFNFGGPAWAREYWSPLSGALTWLRMLLG